MRDEHKTLVRHWGFLGLTLAVAIGAGMLLPGLNRKREELGLSGVTVPGKVPPGLALLVTASGPARAVGINILWMRATRLQEDGKLFELNELCRMITALEPRMPMIWAHWAWNLAYNVSVKFPEQQAAERWRWINNGIATLRDRGIPNNPKAFILYRELAWIYSHKIGGSSDEAHLYYKVRLAVFMDELLGPPPYAEKLQAIADAPRTQRQLFEDNDVRELVERLEATGLDLLGNIIEVLNRRKAVPEAALAILEQAKGKPELARLEAFLRGYYLRTKLKMEPGGAELSLGDILDWTALATKIKDASEAARPSVGRRLWELMPKEAHPTIEFAAQGKPLNTGQQKYLVGVLNALIKNRDLYREADFARVTLPPVVQGYFKKPREELVEQEVLSMNRGLLQSAYRGLIGPSGLMLRLTRRYGPIDWRVPDAMALYWAAAGREVLGVDIEKAANTSRIAFNSVVGLYKSGRLRLERGEGGVTGWIPAPHFGFIEPVLEIHREIVRQYKGTAQEKPTYDGYLNFLRQIIMDLYSHNNIPGALKYWAMLTKEGPETGDLADFIGKRLVENIKNPTHDGYRNFIQGQLESSIRFLSYGDEDRAAGFQLRAQAMYDKYHRDYAKRLTMPPMHTIWQSALLNFLRFAPKFQRDRVHERFPKEVEAAEKKLKTERDRLERERAARPPA